ncbi:MAG: response regulator [Fusobacteriota bacterium]
MKKVLIIDDEQNIRLLLKETLKNVVNVYEAEDGHQGMEKLKKIDPDLILLDIMLPDTTGVELLQNIKNYDSNVKVIMITAYSSIESVINVMDIKISGYIEKPFDPAEIKKKILGILN